MRSRYKGKFKIKKSQKYKGNPSNIIYRSLMELRFMKWCDSSEKILQWSSEEVVIPYISPIDNKRHRYFPDFLIQTAKGWFLIEVKPQIESRPPKKKLVENLNLKKKSPQILVLTPTRELAIQVAEAFQMAALKQLPILYGDQIVVDNNTNEIT